MSSKVLAAAAAAVALGAAGPAGAQAGWSAFRAAEGIPQPHLMEARRLAAQENFWKVPILNTCYKDDASLAQDIIKDPPPTRVADNLYFLGTGKVSAWAIDTGDGLVLIDTLNNQADAEKYIVGGLKQLGLDPARIKAAIISHGHGDHYGGAAFLQERYGTRIYMADVDWPFAATYAAQPRTIARGYGPVPRQDVAVKDGDTLTMGNITIRMHQTPGHTPGPLALIFPITDDGKPHTMIFHGGLTSSSGLSPAMHDAYERVMARVIEITREAGVDSYIANHSNYDDVAMKVAHIRAKTGEPNPFVVGREATLRWLQIARACNLNNRDVDAALAARQAQAGR